MEPSNLPKELREVLSDQGEWKFGHIWVAEKPMWSYSKHIAKVELIYMDHLRDKIPYEHWAYTEVTFERALFEQLSWAYNLAQTIEYTLRKAV